MKSKHVAYILGAAAVILAGACFFVAGGKDTEAPVITVSDAKISYVEGQDEKVLLKGVHAEDNKDGDLSEKVFVENIIDLRDGSADVIYAVIDESKNIGKEHRIITYKAKNEETEKPVQQEQQQEASVPELPKEKEEKNEIVQSGKNPAIWLTQNEVKIKQGTEFHELAYVKDLQDDADEKSVLDRKIRIEGDYDVDQKGEYLLKYYVVDSDGNQSNIEELVLIVE